MGFFKKTEYVNEIIPEISGHQGAMVVIIRNMQCRKNPITLKQKHPYSDFGSELHEELLGKHLVTYENVKQSLQRSGKFTVSFRLRQLPEMSIEISGGVPSNESIFYSDFLDAIINAWEQNNIKPSI